jgi:aspartate racemase
MNKQESIIGIIGGAGPEACIDFQAKLLQLMQKKITILGDKNHPRVIIDNNTSFINRDYQFFNRANGNELQRQILESLKLLESAKVSVAAIICNSAHIYFEQIQQSTSIELINILRIVGQHLQNNKIKKIGLLCTLAMYNSNIYKELLEEYGVVVVVPNRRNQVRLSQIIYLIKAGLYKNNATNHGRLFDIYNHNLMPLITETEYHNLEFTSPQDLFTNVIKDLENTEKVNHFVLGCTELPLISHWYKNFNSQFIDPNLLLANAVLDKCINSKKQEVELSSVT